MDEKNTAAEKIALQMQEAKDKLSADKLSADKNKKRLEAAWCAMKLVLIEDIGKMISRFCYQNEEFAAAVETCQKTLLEIVDEVTKDVDQNNPSLSDVVAYMRACKAYLPEAEVICSFRINIHKEVDDDLLDLENFEIPEAPSGAIILDLFGTGEI